MFKLEFETENDAVRTPDEIADIVKEIANKIRSGHGNGRVRDINGNTIGEWELS